MKVMPNPWLEVPLADYENHMKSAGVAQSAALSELFADALSHCQPESVAVIGIAGGNGLDRIDSSVTRRVVGIDINPAYLDAVRQRYGQMPGLELICSDLTEQIGGCTPVQLVHAALVFEHAGTGLCLENVLSLVDSGGSLSVVLQLPSDTAPDVSRSQFASMQTLSAGFTMIDSVRLKVTIQARGFHMSAREPSGIACRKGILDGHFHAGLLTSESVRALHRRPCPDRLRIPLSMALRVCAPARKSAPPAAQLVASGFQSFHFSRRRGQCGALRAGWAHRTSCVPSIRQNVAQPDRAGFDLCGMVGDDRDGPAVCSNAHHQCARSYPRMSFGSIIGVVLGIVIEDVLAASPHA